VPTETLDPPLFLIDDGAHEGNIHFFFLPPMVPQPTYNGPFDGSLEPVVKICAGHDSQCEQDDAIYTMDTGPGSETVRVVDVEGQDQHYIVNWHTDAVAPGDYRIIVLVGTELGFADVIVDSNRELKNVDTDQFVPLKDGRTLPIKFRIEEGALPLEIAFTSTRISPRGIFLMDRTGGNVTQLSSGGDESAAWFTDGSRIVFESVRDGNPEIYTMTHEGSDVRRLTHIGAQDHHPDPSADGGLIAFQSNRNGPWDIYVMDAEDGANVLRLTSSPGADEMPVWSPDGAQIAFQSRRDGNSEIYLMEANGLGQTNITNHTAADERPDWSPDGSRIVFDSDRDGDFDIYVMEADGTNVVQLTDDPADDRQAVWSADGTQIVFVSWRDGNGDIFLMDADGSNQVNLTNNPAAGDVLPDWRPASPYWNLLKVDFDYDVFGEGWSRTDASVAVDLATEVLRVGTGYVYGDYAQVAFHADLPIVVQSRMRLVQYGRNYLLPHFHVGTGSSLHEGIVTTYLPDPGLGWGLGTPTDRWTGQYGNAPSAEGVWVTLTLEVRADGGRMFSRLDGQPIKTLVASKTWSIPAQTTELYFVQPWDAVCEFDYIYVRSGLVN
jgi:Tol biopolymer transport system component